LSAGCSVRPYGCGKIADFRWKDSRHTFASRLRQRGVAIQDIRDLLGHTSTRMTERDAYGAHGSFARPPAAPAHHRSAAQGATSPGKLFADCRHEWRESQAISRASRQWAVLGSNQ